MLVSTSINHRKHAAPRHARPAPFCLRRPPLQRRLRNSPAAKPSSFVLPSDQPLHPSCFFCQPEIIRSIVCDLSVKYRFNQSYSPFYAQGAKLHTPQLIAAADRLPSPFCPRPDLLRLRTAHFEPNKKDLQCPRLCHKGLSIILARKALPVS